MCLLATQDYVKVERQLTSITQEDIELPRTIKLYPDRVQTEYREFRLEDITDISYRRFGSFRGLLYLHTTGGVFSYTVKTDTEAFVEAVKKQKAK